jgi:hypothetical protein
MLGQAVWKRALSISPEEALFSRRGFAKVNPHTREVLEQAGRSFLEGYNAALQAVEPAGLEQRLSMMAPRWIGFGFEGAAMALRLLDNLSLSRRSRYAAFLSGPGARHRYMIHVGAGWAHARLPWLRKRPYRSVRDLDPLLRWLAIDGYGFHEGYFHWSRYRHGSVTACKLSGYARNAFDQGIGRSMWFVEGADPSRIAPLISTFPKSRQSDLWAGVGLACAYAAGVDGATTKHLLEVSGAYSADLAQGAAFAAETRDRAGNPTTQCDLACRILCRMSASNAAVLVREEMDGLPSDAELPAYEVWRIRIRNRMVLQEGMAS